MSAADFTELLITWFGHDAIAKDDTRAIEDDLRKRWFVRDDAFDAELASRFRGQIEAASAGQLSAWEETPRGALALVLLLDQLTRNVYRDDARAFAADPLAREIAERAIARGFDRQLGFHARAFFYLPFEHGETMALQDRAVRLFQELASDTPELAAAAENLVSFAEKHRAVIARFGRFPHRNAVLGRENTAAEEEFLKSGRGF